jgi:hypothetical protein
MTLTFPFSPLQHMLRLWRRFMAWVTAPGREDEDEADELERRSW